VKVIPLERLSGASQTINEFILSRHTFVNVASNSIDFQQCPIDGQLELDPKLSGSGGNKIIIMITNSTLGIVIYFVYATLRCFLFWKR
jgi:hypothetical protein